MQIRYNKNSRTPYYIECDDGSKFFLEPQLQKNMLEKERVVHIVKMDAQYKKQILGMFQMDRYATNDILVWFKALDYLTTNGLITVPVMNYDTRIYIGETRSDVASEGNLFFKRVDGETIFLNQVIKVNQDEVVLFNFEDYDVYRQLSSFLHYCEENVDMGRYKKLSIVNNKKVSDILAFSDLIIAGILDVSSLKKMKSMPVSEEIPLIM